MATENYYRPDGTLAIQLAHQQDKREMKLKLIISLIIMVMTTSLVDSTS